LNIDRHQESAGRKKICRVLKYIKLTNNTFAAYKSLKMKHTIAEKAENLSAKQGSAHVSPIH
jgi:hypothetical protein